MSGTGPAPCPMSEQTVGWALHALEPGEAAEVVEHLTQCARCRRLADDVAGVTVELADALPRHEPPSRLRAAIVDEARRTPQVPTERPVPAAPPGRHSRPETRPATASPPSPVPSRTDARPGWSRRPGRVLVAATAALAVIVGGGVAVGEYRQMQAERDASLAQARDMEGMLADLARPGTSHAFLAAPGDPRPVAALVVGDGGRELMPMGLAPNSVADETYVLWGLDGDAAPTAVGTFDVRSGAAGPMSVPSPESGTFTEYAVSLERGRQAPAAPSAVVAAGQVET